MLSKKDMGKIEKLKKKALEYERKDKKYDALRQYEKAIELDMNNAEIRYLSAKLKFQLGLYSGVVIDCGCITNIAILTENQRNEMYYMSGQANLHQKQYNVAINNFNRVVASSDKYKISLYGKGQAKRQLASNQEAIKDLTTALQVKIKDDDLLEGKIFLERGYCNENLNLYDDAITDFEEAHKLIIKDKLLGPMLGIVAMHALKKAKQKKEKYLSKCKKEGLKFTENKEYQKAKDKYTIYLKYFPYDAEILYRRAEANFYLENYKDSFTDCNQAIENNNNFSNQRSRASTYYIRAKTLSALERYEEAIAAYDIAIAYNPEFNGYHCRGTVKEQLGQYQEAISDYVLALKHKDINAMSYTLYIDLAHCKIQLSSYEEALEDLNSAINLASTKAEKEKAIDTFNNVKNLHQKKEDLRKENEYKNHLALKKKIEEYKQLAAKEKAGCQYNQARDYYTQILAMDGELGEIYYLRAETNYLLKQFKEVIADANKIVINYEDNCNFYPHLMSNISKKQQIDAHYFRAIAYYSLGNFARAANDFNTVKKNTEIGIYVDLFDVHFKNAVCNKQLSKYIEVIENLEKAEGMIKNDKNKQEIINDYRSHIKLDLKKAAENFIKKANEEKDSRGKPDYAAQLNLYNQALKLNPENGRAYYLRGEIFNFFGKYAEAIENFNKALTLSDEIELFELSDLHALRGVAYYKVQQYEKAYSDFHSARCWDGCAVCQFYFLTFLMGCCQMEIKNYQEAVERFRDVIDITKDNLYVHDEFFYPSLLFKLGICMQKQANYAEAIDNYTLAIKWFK
ncbi:MAG: tetratricopeptide repeat protein, partial [Gammaproteobacteria bacterium]